MNAGGYRYEMCVCCGLEWNVSRFLDLSGRVYVCAKCAQRKRFQYAPFEEKRRKK